MRFLLFFIFISIFSTACSNNTHEAAKGAIKFGDSASIITENDPEKLKDFVEDYDHSNTDTPAVVIKDSALAKPISPAPTAIKPAAVIQPEVAAPTPQPVAVTKGAGLNIDFKDLSVFIPAINTRTFGSNNISDRGASFQLTAGTLMGNGLKIANGVISKVSQRYISSVQIKTNYGNLVLGSLSKYTSDWLPLNNNNGIYPMAGLNQLNYPASTMAALKIAVQKAIKNKQWDSQKEKEVLSSLPNNFDLNKAPFSIILRSVMWKIEGKTANGKPFNKQLRIDLP